MRMHGTRPGESGAVVPDGSDGMHLTLVRDTYTGVCMCIPRVYISPHTKGCVHREYIAYTSVRNTYTCVYTCMKSARVDASLYLTVDHPHLSTVVVSCVYTHDAAISL